MDIVSRTAVWVAAARAIGAREPDPDVRNPDYLAERLLGDVSAYDVDIAAVDALDESYDVAMSDLEVASMVRTMIVRTRFIDEALEHALEEGVAQVLVLGAGLGSHAYRFEDLLHGIPVFEVDRPAMLRHKRERVLGVLGAVPENVRYVAADIGKDDLRDVLEANGCDFAQRSFVIMEGLTMYLAEDALRDVFALVASEPPGSRVVFDFVTDAMVAAIMNIDLAQVPETARQFIVRFLNLVRDEPFSFGFPLNGERAWIEAFGLDIADLIILDGDEAVRRYLTKADGTELAQETLAKRPPVPEAVARAQRETMSYRICEAVVAQRH